MYTVASPHPNSRGGGQLPNPKSAILCWGEMLTPNYSECNSALTSVI